ncbi:MAG: hypothetical protein SFU53_02745 [Terrimicrobiaceae bacterium]|nr:hypothetical protein [Terrimicrobiaceae bacterium]
MNTITWTYTIYLAVSVTLTIWVGHTLWKNGRVFLVDCFHGREELADSVNHLLVVGFYLVNAGFVALFLRLGGEVEGTRGVFEALAGKLGVVLLVLGAMHFFNLLVLAKVRGRAVRRSVPPLPQT